MLYTIENDSFVVSIDSYGAELTSVKRKEDFREYVWDAHTDAWNKHSPVLFPYIGFCKNNSIKYDGEIYPATKHGFARDKEFCVEGRESNSISFSLLYDNESLVTYPFKFKLILKYVLENNELSIYYEVNNMDDKTIYFSLGAHPAFMGINESLTGNKICIHKDCVLKKSLIDINTGLFFDETEEVKYKDGLIDISLDTFDNDALVFEDYQINKVSLLEGGIPFLEATFDSPIVGIWSPIRKNNPFICIEPWFGRADKISFDGNIEERACEQSLKVGDTFNSLFKLSFL